MNIGLDREKVRLTEYDPNWVALFREEADFLSSILGGEAISIEHIGSTAIPSIKSKPVIDILVQIPSDFLAKASEAKLISLNYEKIEFKRRKEPMFSKTLERNIASHNVHFARQGNLLANALINFRDALLEDTELAKRYEELKLDLAKEYHNKRNSYYEAKIDFFESVVGKYFDPLPEDEK